MSFRDPFNFSSFGFSLYGPPRGQESSPCHPHNGPPHRRARRSPIARYSSSSTGKRQLRAQELQVAPPPREARAPVRRIAAQHRHPHSASSASTTLSHYTQPLACPSRYAFPISGFGLCVCGWCGRGVAERRQLWRFVTLFPVSYPICGAGCGPGFQAQTGPRGRGRDPLGQGPGGPWAQDVGYAWRT